MGLLFFYLLSTSNLARHLPEQKIFSSLNKFGIRARRQRRSVPSAYVAAKTGDRIVAAGALEGVLLRVAFDGRYGELLLKAANSDGSNGGD